MAITLKTLETWLEEMALFRQQKAELEAEVSGVDEQIEILKDKLIAGMKESGISSIPTATATVTLNTYQVPQVQDWAAFDAFAIATKSPDLYQRRISVPAWRERIENGVKVPGVELFAQDRLTFKLSRAAAAEKAEATFVKESARKGAKK